MVSNTRDVLPEPLKPVTTTNLLWGISTLIFFKLFTRAPLTEIKSLFTLFLGSALTDFERDILLRVPFVLGVLLFVSELAFITAFLGIQK